MKLLLLNVVFSFRRISDTTNFVFWWIDVTFARKEIFFEVRISLFLIKHALQCLDEDSASWSAMSRVHLFFSFILGCVVQTTSFGTHSVSFLFWFYYIWIFRLGLKSVILAHRYHVKLYYLYIVVARAIFWPLYFYKYLFHIALRATLSEEIAPIAYTIYIYIYNEKYRLFILKFIFHFSSKCTVK